MPTRCQLSVCVAVLTLACSSADTNYARESGVASASDDAVIVPEGLHVTPLPGGNGVLTLIALTLRTGARRVELYAAVRNDGATPACSAALAVELFDEQEQSLAASISGLLSRHFYRRTDGSNAIAACVSPGDVAMAALDLPSDLSVDAVRHVVYRCPYFALDVTASGAITIGQIAAVTDHAGTVYRGTLVNGLDLALSGPSVSVFPLTRTGRPLALAIGQSKREVQPGESWAFETSSVSAPGADYAAYPAGAFMN